MISNPNLDNSQLSEAPLDLRAPTFARVRKGGWLLRFTTLIAVDFIVLLIAWILVEYPVLSAIPNLYVSILSTISIQIGVLYIQGTYAPGDRRHDYWNIIKTMISAHGIILLVCILYRPIEDLSRSTLIIFWLVSTSFVCIGRLAVEVTLNYLRQRKILGRNAVFIICSPTEKEQVTSFIKKETRYTIVGCETSQALDRENRQETLENLNKLGVTEVFVSWEAIQKRMFLCWLFQASGITVHLLPVELKAIYRDLVIHNVGGITCLSFVCPVITGRDFWLKRCFDVCFAFLFLIFTFPIYVPLIMEFVEKLFPSIDKFFV